MKHTGSDLGWYRRYLPHYDQTTVIQHVNFHLADSFPKEALAKMEARLADLPDAQARVERRKFLDHLLDQGHGACWLREPAIAEMVQQSLLHFDGKRYKLGCWAVMPNHVHVIVQALEGWNLSAIVRSWKSYTGRRIAEHRQQPGTVWYPEFFDRFIRDQEHFENALRYVEENPVKAGLCRRPEDWPWGSARVRKAAEE